MKKSQTTPSLGLLLKRSLFVLIVVLGAAIWLNPASTGVSNLPMLICRVCNVNGAGTYSP